MKLNRTSAFACFAFACGLIVSALPAAHAGPARRVAAQLDDCIDRFFVRAKKSLSRSGGSFAILKDGEILSARPYGIANQQWRVPVAADTKFRIWSLSKTFTATAIMMLQEQGKLRIEDKACSYLPTCPDSWRPITIEQLLAHTSGIEEPWGLNADDAVTSTFYRKIIGRMDQDPRFRAPVSRAQALALFQSAPLIFEPGTGYDYSNAGYFVLGMIIEKASGQSYGAALDGLIFKPLGMTDTGNFDNDRIIAKSAESYAYQPDGSVAPAAPLDYSWLIGSASLYSTAADIAKFDRAFARGRLLPAAMVRRMATVVPITKRDGLGLEIDARDGWSRYGHLGAGNWFNAAWWRYSDGFGIIVLTTGLTPEPIIPQLRRIVAADGQAPASVVQSCGK